MQIIAGVTAIVGHIFPVFAGFRGGKGVATVFGVLLALHPLLTICCIGVFLFILLNNRHRFGLINDCRNCFSLLLLFLSFDTPSLSFKIFSIVVAIALIITHRKNIGRLA